METFRMQYSAPKGQKRNGPVKIATGLQEPIKRYHSITLDEDKCVGCTSCIKRCPTEAIRVHKSKARIINSRCIDCGECIRVCPHGAKHAITTDLLELDNYKYRVAIPAPAIYGQYRSARSRNHILTALKKLGFDDVFEVALGAEYVSNATRQYLKTVKKEKNLEGPVISTACPAIIRLIQVRFPNLMDNMLPLEAPVEVAARLAREKAKRDTSYGDSAIGIFFISPCASKMFSQYFPLRGEKSPVDGVISFQEIYMNLRNKIKSLKDEEIEDLEQATNYGVRWPSPGGESMALDINKFIAVDGIHDVVKIFETIENSNKFDDIDFLEALACKGGCLGGALTVKNHFVSQVIMKTMRDEAKAKDRENELTDLPDRDIDYHDILWDKQLEHIPIHKLDTDMAKAMKKLERMEKIADALPSLDCGACGAPSCRALAEDIVRDEAKITDCVFVLRERVRALANQMFELESMLPPTMIRDEKRGSDSEAESRHESLSNDVNDD